MKKMKLFILTYKREDVLNELIDNIFTSDFKDLENTEVNIINNHTNFKLTSKYKDKINKVYHNDTRPDWSSGNLGENWNQALMFGFKNLKNPDSEFVVTLQNDCVLHPNWCAHLLKMHEKYTFIAGEFGDNVVSYKAEAVRRIGLWDEQFAGGGHREADYYLRALYFNKEYSLINDTMHGRVWNPNNDYLTLDIPGNRNLKPNLERWPDGRLIARPDNDEQENIWKGCRGGIINEYNTQYLFHKWGGTHTIPVAKHTWMKNWPKELTENPPKIKGHFVYMKYPYFEKDIYNLHEHGYWVPPTHGDGRGNYLWDEWEQRTRESNKDSY